jgi:hypothetical protein
MQLRLIRWLFIPRDQRGGIGTITPTKLTPSQSRYHYRRIWNMHSAPHHVEPDKEADASPSPFFSAFAGSPFSSGFVADALNDCSKSAMISSICSVPTEIRIRSYHQALAFPAQKTVNQKLTSVTPELSLSSSLNCSCVVVHG